MLSNCEFSGHFEVRQLHADLAAKGFDDVGASDGVVMRVISGARGRLASWLEITPQSAPQIADSMQRRG
jgi:hypothetical protein